LEEQECSAQQSEFANQPTFSYRIPEREHAACVKGILVDSSRNSKHTGNIENLIESDDAIVKWRWNYKRARETVEQSEHRHDEWESWLLYSGVPELVTMRAHSREC
jgi:hypothetical protein